jgi:thiopeptide-type bacteriocin biosynthesis protein
MEEIAALATQTGRDRFVAARAWAVGRKLPSLIELKDGDNELLVDFDNPLSVDAFVELARRRRHVTLVELLPAPADLCVAGPDGRFTHEVHVPVTRTALREMRDDLFEWPRHATSPRHGGGTRLFAPGSAWLFAKIYAGPSEVDRVLTRVVAPLISEGVAASLVHRWFFLRYSDPSHHLRLRLRGEPRALYGELLPRLSHLIEPWLAAGTVGSMQLDTYQPEIERYGGPLGLDLSEQVFEVDSEAALALLEELDCDDRSADARWQLAFRGLEGLIDDLSWAEGHKRLLIDGLRDRYAREFGAQAAGLKHALGARFRLHRRTLEALWDRNQDATSDLADGLAIWRRRSNRLRPIVEQLRHADAERLLWMPYVRLAASYLHMHVNRLARAEGKAHELVMFDFLNRHMESLDARARLESHSSR